MVSLAPQLIIDLILGSDGLVESIEIQLFSLNQFLYLSVSSLELMNILQFGLRLLCHRYQHLLNFGVTILTECLFSGFILKCTITSTNRSLQIDCWKTKLSIFEHMRLFPNFLGVLKFIIVKCDRLPCFVLKMTMLNKLHQVLLIEKISLSL